MNFMEYRKLPKGNEQISVIGFGGSGLHQAGEKEAVETINLALENGINYFDLAISFCRGQALEPRLLPGTGTFDRVSFQASL